MFMVFSKEKILSYLVSLGTVTLLFVMSFAITARNNEVLETSANAISINNEITSNQTHNNINNTTENESTNNINSNNQTYNDINETNCVNNKI